MGLKNPLDKMQVKSCFILEFLVKEFMTVIQNYSHSHYHSLASSVSHCSHASYITDTMNLMSL